MSGLFDLIDTAGIQPVIEVDEDDHAPAMAAPVIGNSALDDQLATLTQLIEHQAWLGERYKAVFSEEVAKLGVAVASLEATATVGSQRMDAGLSAVLDRIAAAQAQTESQVARITRLANAGVWRSLLIAGAALGLAAIASAWAVWSNLRTAEQLHTANARAALLQGLTIGNCGGQPCVRMDKDAPRWGPDRDYLLLDASGTNVSTNSKTKRSSAATP